MSIRFASGVAQKIKDTIATWGVSRRSVAAEVFEQLETLDDDPALGEKDEEGIFGGAFLYQFRIQRSPLILRATVAYDVRQIAGDRVVEILDFRSGFAKGRGNA